MTDKDIPPKFEKFDDYALVRLDKVKDKELLNALMTLAEIHSNNKKKKVKYIKIKTNPDCYYVKTNGDWFYFCEQ